MNLRTLKKLSKRAAPLLPLLGYRSEQFPAVRDDNYASVFIGDRKHWERRPCHPTFKGLNDWSTPKGADRVFTTRAGRTVVMRPPSHPRKGTIMVGDMDGGEQPEWSEETAWEALSSIVWSEFTDWSGERPVALRSFRTPREVLIAAHELIAERQAKRRRP